MAIGSVVKTVKRQAHYEMLLAQVTGLAASVGALTDMNTGEEGNLAENIRREILRILGQIIPCPRLFVRS